MVRAMTRLTGGQTGWHRVQPQLGIDEQGALLLPPRADDDDDDTPYMQRILAAHQRQFTPMWLEAQTPCSGVIGSERPAAGTVYVLVHGIGGVGNEWVGVIP